MTSAIAAKEHLTTRLSGLLKIDNVAEGIMDYLLTIDSRQDLLDYISQLLGSSDDAVVEFVNDVCSYRQGDYVPPPNNEAATNATTTERQPLDYSGGGTNRGPSKKKNAPLAAQQTKSTMTKQVAKKQSSAAAAAAVANAAPIGSSTLRPTITATQEPTAKMDPDRQAKNVVQPTAAQMSTATKERLAVKQQTTAPPALPAKGKAKSECGCFGSLHEALTNCLHCGRVACTKEGYTFCPFCGYQLAPIRPPDKGNVDAEAAWELKERLLGFQDKRTVRTEITDDHADQFTTSRWLTRDEEAEATEQDEERRRKLEKRAAMQLNVGL